MMDMSNKPTVKNNIKVSSVSLFCEGWLIKPNMHINAKEYPHQNTQLPEIKEENKMLGS